MRFVPVSFYDTMIQFIHLNLEKESYNLREKPVGTE